MRTALLVTLSLLAFGKPGRAEEPKLRATLIGHQAAVNAVALAPFWTMLASASDDGTVKVWNLTTGKNIATLAHPAPVLSVAFDDCGLRLIAGGRDGTVKIWSLVTGKNTATIRAAFPARDVWFSNSIWDRCLGENRVGVTCPATSKPLDGTDSWDLNNGTKIPLAINHNSLNLDVAAGSELGWAIANEEPHYPQHPVAVGDISFTPAPKGGPVRDPIALRGHKGRVRALEFRPLAAKWLVSGSLDKTIKVWNVVTGRCTATLAGHSGAVRCLVFSADGKMLLSGSADATIKLWDMPGDGKE